MWFEYLLLIPHRDSCTVSVRLFFLSLKEHRRVKDYLKFLLRPTDCLSCKLLLATVQSMILSSVLKTWLVFFFSFFHTRCSRSVDGTDGSQVIKVNPDTMTMLLRMWKHLLNLPVWLTDSELSQVWWSERSLLILCSFIAFSSAYFARAACSQHYTSQKRIQNLLSRGVPFLQPAADGLKNTSFWKLHVAK